MIRSLTDTRGESIPGNLELLDVVALRGGADEHHMLRDDVKRNGNHLAHDRGTKAADKSPHHQIMDIQLSRQQMPNALVSADIKDAGEHLVTEREVKRVSACS